MSKSYSIPECPKVGKYDGLGMAAVPLAIADKERERGGSSNNSYTGNYGKNFGKAYEDGYKDGFKDGRKDGMKIARQEGMKTGRVEVYRKIMKCEDLEKIQTEADAFLIVNDRKYKKE